MSGRCDNVIAMKHRNVEVRLLQRAVIQSNQLWNNDYALEDWTDKSSPLTKAQHYYLELLTDEMEEQE